MKKIPRRSDIPSQHEGTEGAARSDDIRIKHSIDGGGFDVSEPSEPDDAVLSRLNDAERVLADAEIEHLRVEASADVTQKYLNEIGKHRLLTAE